MGKKKIQKRDDELLLFQQVKCAGFIVKERHFPNGIWLDAETNTLSLSQGTVNKRGLSDASINRTYYTSREVPFTGVYVGSKPVVVQAKIEMGVNSDGSLHRCKTPTKVIDCGIVYFAPNRKHLVPLEYLNVK